MPEERDIGDTELEKMYAKMRVSIMKAGMYYVFLTMNRNTPVVTLKVGTTVMVRTERPSKKKGRPIWVAVAQITRGPFWGAWYELLWKTPGPLSDDYEGTLSKRTYPLRLLRAVDKDTDMVDLQERIGTACSDVWLVKNILAKRKSHDDWEYLVAWEGWNFSHCSWQMR